MTMKSARRLAAGASKARLARDLKVSRMTVYRALDIIPSQTKLPEKPPTASIALHLIIENFNKRGGGRKPARERIEAMLERDYAMVKNGGCGCKLTVAFDFDPDGISLDEEIQSLLTEMFNITENDCSSMEADIYEVGGQQQSW
ncbi:helix-turn-helix domain-containing protein [Novosphingobium sp. G106]|uniref:helix-turn-helix domain-containing protein n=1 Tax=Novosphingobium sp. G106 TaxID=2849500 RepID=UPI0020C41D52|nr:helix-turn-helix domain-containing protein [Novosphingobium sp. G106]